VSVCAGVCSRAHMSLMFRISLAAPLLVLHSNACVCRTYILVPDGATHSNAHTDLRSPTHTHAHPHARRRYSQSRRWTRAKWRGLSQKDACRFFLSMPSSSQVSNASLFACLPVCLFVCLFVCLSVCMYVGSYLK
jgi:hypothetical protein